MSSSISIYIRSKEGFTELNSYGSGSEMFALLIEEFEYGKITPMTKSIARYLIDTANAQLDAADKAIAGLIERKAFLRDIKVGTVDDVMEKLGDIDSTIDEYKQDREIDLKCKYVFEFLYEIIDNADYDYMRKKGIDCNKLIYVAYECEEPKVGYNVD